MSQNFKNHSRYVPFYHMVLTLLWIAFLGGAINNARHSSKENQYSACLLVLLAIILGIMYWYIRAFPLKAQDRAIRAEENLRHYVLTGNLLDPRLRMGQIVALRFAPDDEFVALASRAVTEKMSASDIKKSIQNWKADYNRV